MSILISAKEPSKMKLALGEFGVESNIPYDFKIFTPLGVIAIERKHFPNDFIASVDDDRLSRELAAMRSDSKYQILVIEGKANYTRKGNLIIGRIETKWSLNGIKNLIRSIQFVEGCYIEYTDNMIGTATFLKDISAYFMTDKHLSLRSRQSLRTDWLIPTDKERLLYFYQGLPGIKYGRAIILAEAYPCPLLLYEASILDISKLKGIGKGLSKNIYNFLHFVV